jgi:hypothetical protein
VSPTVCEEPGATTPSEKNCYIRFSYKDCQNFYEATLWGYAD